MASNKDIAEKTAASLGLSFDKKKSVGYGEYGGFTILIKPCQSNTRGNTVSVILCAQKDGHAADSGVISSMGIPDGVKYSVEGFIHVFDAKVTFKAEQVIEKLTETVRNATSALANAGYVNCNIKGEEGQTEVYLFKDNYVFITSSDAAQITAELNDAKMNYDETAENKLLGIIGALAGSLAGVLVILLLGRLGRVSVLGGFVMGIVSIWGYKKLGHKLSTAGAVICTVIAVIMSYLSFRVDAAIDLMNIFKDIEDAEEYTFSFFFANAKILYELGEALSTYYINMFLIVLSGAGGAASAIWADRAKTKNGFKLEKLGE